jgi:hypothetical protein
MYKLKEANEELSQMWDYHRIPITNGEIVILRVPGGYLHTVNTQQTGIIEKGASTFIEEL